MSDTGGRLITPRELAEYRHRAQFGPYKSFGDAGTNTPGDWDRIAGAAAAFAADPPPYWVPVFEGPWRASEHGAATEPNRAEARTVRDAAFYALVMEDTALRDAVWAWLVAQSQVEEADFSDATRYDGGEASDGQFVIQIWLVVMTYVYAYCRLAGAGTTQERDDVGAWLLAGGRWRATIIDGNKDGLFVDRSGLVPSGTGTLDPDEKTHTEGHETSLYQKAWNNRQAIMYMAMGFAGLLLDHEDSVFRMKRWCQEYIELVYYPDRDFGEMHRSRVTAGAAAETGWGYTYATMGVIALFADALWRIRGDSSLYDFTTRRGVFGTECEEGDPDKTLKDAIITMGYYGNDTFERYGNQSTTGDADMRIDSRSPRDGSNWRGHHDVFITVANRYYDDPEIRAQYMRDPAAGFLPYWSNPTNPGGEFDGTNRVECGSLFMHAGMEGVDPLNTSEEDSVSDIKISQLPLATQFSDDDVLVGNVDGVTSQVSTHLLAAGKPLLDDAIVTLTGSVQQLADIPATATIARLTVEYTPDTDEDGGIRFRELEKDPSNDGEFVAGGESVVIGFTHGALEALRFVLVGPGAGRVIVKYYA